MSEYQFNPAQEAVLKTAYSAVRGAWRMRHQAQKVVFKDRVNGRIMSRIDRGLAKVEDKGSCVSLVVPISTILFMKPTAERDKLDRFLVQRALLPFHSRLLSQTQKLITEQQINRLPVEVFEDGRRRGRTHLGDVMPGHGVKALCGQAVEHKHIRLGQDMTAARICESCVQEHRKLFVDDGFTNVDVIACAEERLLSWLQDYRKIVSSNSEFIFHELARVQDYKVHSYNQRYRQEHEPPASDFLVATEVVVGQTAKRVLGHALVDLPHNALFVQAFLCSEEHLRTIVKLSAQHCERGHLLGEYYSKQAKDSIVKRPNLDSVIEQLKEMVPLLGQDLPDMVVARKQLLRDYSEAS